METGAIKVYGTKSCEDTQQTLSDLQAMGVPYEYIDIDKDAKAREWVIEQNGGIQRTPTVDVAGALLIEPSAHDLGNIIRGMGMTE